MVSEADGDNDTPSEDDDHLARRLLAEWDEGRGTSKSRIEIREWGDATAHGRRFIRRTLGQSTSRPSPQSDRIGDLQGQLRKLGVTPDGVDIADWEVQLQHARAACFQALRVWNDPMGTYRAGTFALLFVAAWNSLAIALLQIRGEEWRQLDELGSPIQRDGSEQTLTTMDLVERAFAGPRHRGLRENVRDWVNLRNCAAHRHLPALDASVIPQAQAGLVNFEAALATGFGEEWALAEQLSVPLQLSGFRDPGVLASVKQLQSSLPLEVQAILSRVADASPELLGDETYALRVAFIPVVPASGHRPDAVAYFVRPGEVPEELGGALDRFVVLPKVGRPQRPNLGAKEVVAAVGEQIPWLFNLVHHVALAQQLGVRPRSDALEKSDTDIRYCEYVPAAKLYLYNRAWVDRLVALLETAEGFEANLGRVPRDQGSLSYRRNRRSRRRLREGALQASIRGLTRTFANSSEHVVAGGNGCGLSRTQHACSRWR